MNTPTYSAPIQIGNGVMTGPVMSRAKGVMRMSEIALWIIFGVSWIYAVVQIIMARFGGDWDE